MRFAVLMRKQFIDNPWISFRWAPQEVLPDFGQFTNTSISGDKISGQFLGRDDQGESWLFTGYELSLFPDEAEGYYLNLSATLPAWFVMWRLEEDIERYIDAQSIELAKSEPTFAVPHRISVSYNEAGRLLDGGESVDSVLLSRQLMPVEWVLLNSANLKIELQINTEWLALQLQQLVLRHRHLLLLVQQRLLRLPQQQHQLQQHQRRGN